MQEGGRRTLLVFRVRGAAVALDLEATIEVLRMVALTPLAAAGRVLLGVIDYRGLVVPVLDPAAPLGREPGPPGPNSNIVVARFEDRTVGILADEIEGLVEIGPGELCPREHVPALPADSCVGGAVRRPGGFILLLDGRALLAAESTREMRGGGKSK